MLCMHQLRFGRVELWANTSGSAAATITVEHDISLARMVGLGGVKDWRAGPRAICARMQKPRMRRHSSARAGGREGQWYSSVYLQTHAMRTEVRMCMCAVRLCHRTKTLLAQIGGLLWLKWVGLVAEAIGPANVSGRSTMAEGGNIHRKLRSCWPKKTGREPQAADDKRDACPLLGPMAHASVKHFGCRYGRG